MYSGPFEVRIACGSTVDSVALETGYNWSKDRGYTGGSSAPLNVTNRIAPQLNTLRYFEITDGPDNCYNISVPSGHYLVRFDEASLLETSTKLSTFLMECIMPHKKFSIFVQVLFLVRSGR